MKNKYIYEYNDFINGVENEKTIKNMSIKDVQILVTTQPIDSYGEHYFNVYFIDGMFKIKPINNLREQIPVENEPKDWEKYLKVQYLEYIAWRDLALEIEICTAENVE